MFNQKTVDETVERVKESVSHYPRTTLYLMVVVTLTFALQVFETLHRI